MGVWGCLQCVIHCLPFSEEGSPSSEQRRGCIDRSSFVGFEALLLEVVAFDSRLGQRHDEYDAEKKQPAFNGQVQHPVVARNKGNRKREQVGAQ